MSHHDEDDEDVKAHEARDWELIQGEDPEAQNESLTFAESAETLLREIDDRTRLYSALRTKADALYSLKRFDEAKDACLESAGHAASQLMDGKAGQMFFNAGGCAYNLKQHEQAVELCLKAAGFLESASSPLDAGVALAWAGRNHFALEAFDSAMEVYKRAIEIFEQEGALLKVGDCSRLLAKAYLGAGEFALAERALDRADACLEFLPCEETTEKVRFSRARLLAARGDHSLAIKAFAQLFEAAKELGNVEFTTKIAFEQAKSDMAMGQYDKAAKTYRHLALALEGTSRPITKLECLRQLVKAHELAGNTLDQVATLDEILALPEMVNLPAESNLLKLQLGLTFSTFADDTRGLTILEALPRNVFDVGSESWMEHAIGLLQNYEKLGRSSECLILANEVLATADLDYFEALLPEIHFIKASALSRLGQESRTRAEAQRAFELWTKAAKYEKAKVVQAKFLSAKVSETDPSLFSVPQTPS
jgi:tetratricopeptide (TPR) repeat protein